MNIHLELAKFNHIKYFDEPHKYYIGEQELISGTTFVGLYKPKFESQAMAKSSAKKKGVEPEDLLAEWDMKKNIASMRGTLFHAYAENYLNNKVFPYDDTFAGKIDAENDVIKDIYLSCVKLWMEFYQDSSSTLIPVKSEIVIGCDEWGIAGMIDQLYWNTKMQEYQIYDWKTSKEIRDKSKYGKRMKAPLGFLPDCEVTSFGLQLSLYRLIIHKMTNIKIGKMYVIHVHETLDKYQIVPIPDYTQYVELLINDYLKLNNKQK